MPVMQGVVRRQVVLIARYEQPDRMLRVVRLKARCAVRDRVLRVIPPERLGVLA